MNDLELDQEMMAGALAPPQANEVHPGQVPPQALNPKAPVDPVSGNPVPVGSEPQNVRDNIPAKLSEGEFVLPADVVKFYGVDKLSKMIEKARMAMAEQSQGGKIVNQDDDELPFPEEELMMAEGGEVDLSKPFNYRAYAVDPNPNDNIGHAPLTPGAGQNVEVKVFRDNTGFIRYVPFVGGVPMGQVPEGSQEVGGEDKVGAPTNSGSGMAGGEQGKGLVERAEEDAGWGTYDARTRTNDELQKDYLGQQGIVNALGSPAGRIGTTLASVLGGPVGMVAGMAAKAQKPALSAIEREMASRGLGIAPGRWDDTKAESFDKGYYGDMNQPGGRYSGQRTEVTNGNAATVKGDWNPNTARTPTKEELNSGGNSKSDRDGEALGGGYGDVSDMDTSDGWY